MKKKRKWIKWLILLAIAAVAAGWIFLFSQGTQTAAYNEMKATAGDLTTYYNFDGVVHARRTQTVTAGAAGKVKTVYVEQNQQVEEGDKLYKLEDGETVRAGIDGEITSLNVTPGDVVAAGSVTAQIIDMDDLEVHINVDEYDVQAVVPGTAAEVTVLAVANTYAGEVVSLDKNGTSSGDLSYYTARIDLLETDGVYPGMQVSAKMLRSQALDTTLIRMNALQFDEYNQPYVYLPGADGEAVRTPVTVGINDGIHCQIISGVSAGDTVLVPTGMSLADMMEMMQQMR